MSNIKRIMAKVAYLQKLSNEQEDENLQLLTTRNNNPELYNVTTDVAPSGLLQAELDVPSNPYFTARDDINTPVEEKNILNKYYQNDYIRTLLGMGDGALLGAGAGALTNINPVLADFEGATAGELASAIAPYLTESLIKDNII